MSAPVARLSQCFLCLRSASRSGNPRRMTVGFDRVAAGSTLRPNEAAVLAAFSVTSAAVSILLVMAAIAGPNFSTQLRTVS
jgi:hypothetical protein